MATFKYRDAELYYEDYGSGAPLLILNGIFMSCASWAGFVEVFSATNRLLLLDLADQGRSSKMNREFDQSFQTEVVLAFLDHLGLEKANIAGISYGGEVAVRLAANYPVRVDKLVLANTCAHTSSWLREIGHSWEQAMNTHDGHAFFTTCIPVVYSPGFFDSHYDWAKAREQLFVDSFSAEVYDAFARLTRSAESYDERDRLGQITAPTLVISSEFDYVTPLGNQLELVAGIPDSYHAVIKDAGHAAMYEKPVEFSALVLGFVNHDLTSIKID